MKLKNALTALALVGASACRNPSPDPVAVAEMDQVDTMPGGSDTGESYWADTGTEGEVVDPDGEGVVVEETDSAITAVLSCDETAHHVTSSDPGGDPFIYNYDFVITPTGDPDLLEGGGGRACLEGYVCISQSYLVEDTGSSWSVEDYPDRLSAYGELLGVPEANEDTLRRATVEFVEEEGGSVIMTVTLGFREVLVEGRIAEQGHQVVDVRAAVVLDSTEGYTLCELVRERVKFLLVDYGEGALRLTRLENEEAEDTGGVGDTGM